MTSESIRAEIKNRINQSGVKQKKIAEIAGYGEKEFSNILKGRKRIDAIDVFRISQALGITPNELFGIEGGKPMKTYKVTISDKFDNRRFICVKAETVGQVLDDVPDRELQMNETIMQVEEV